MPFVDSSSQLEPLLFQMKQYKNLTKSTIEILPSSGQTLYGAGSKLTFTLPYASLISLEDLALHFDYQGIAPQVGGKDVVRVMPPKDVASLISEVDIRVNGQTIQHLTQYGDIVNLLNIFEEAKTAKKVLQGCDVNKMKKKKTPDDGTFSDANDRVLAPATDDNNKHKYVINHWYGLLGARGKEVSSNFIDTNMVGEMNISFVFAKGNVCFFGETPDEARMQASTVPANTVVDADITTAMTNPTSGSFSISNAKMSMVRYNLPQSYTEALRSNLSSGAKYQIAFNHYEIHSQTANKSGDVLRWNENSRDIKGLLAFFTNDSRDSTTIASAYDGAVKTSKYFKYDNPIHENSHFQIGSVLMPQNALDSTDCFLELTRAVQGARGNNVEFLSTLETVEDFVSSYFMNYLSLEMSEGMTLQANDGKKLLSGLSSEQLPISCSYRYKNNSNSAYVWAKNVNVMSLTTRLLVIENAQNCYVEI